MKNILYKFYTCALKFLETRPLDETYALIVREATSLFGTERGSVFLNDKSNILQRVYSTVPEQDQIDPRKSGISSQVFKSGEPIVIYKEEFIKNHPEAMPIHIETWVVIPLLYHETKLGILSIKSKKHIDYNEDEMNTLKLFGSMASLAISKSKLFEKESELLEKYDSLLKKVIKKSEAPIPSLEAFSALLRRKLKQGDAPQFIWAELLLWETYQNIRTLRASVTK
jgi:GAF domain-containing protein